MRAATYDMKAAAREIKFKGGRNKLIKLLKENYYFNPDNTPVRSLIEQGLFKIEDKSATTRGGMNRRYLKAVATSEGLTWLQNLAKQHNLLQ